MGKKLNISDPCSTFFFLQCVSRDPLCEPRLSSFFLVFTWTHSSPHRRGSLTGRTLYEETRSRNDF